VLCWIITYTLYKKNSIYRDMLIDMMITDKNVVDEWLFFPWNESQNVKQNNKNIIYAYCAKIFIDIINIDI